MELTREDVAQILDSVRNYLLSDNKIKSIVDLDVEYDGHDLIYGVTNEFLAELMETITGNKIDVVGTVETLYACPCCGYKTLTEGYNPAEGTGYCICPFCNWEDDGTTDVSQYMSINRGSIEDYRKRNKKITNKWRK